METHWFEDIVKNLYPASEGIFYIVSACLLLAGGLLSVITIFASRIAKSHYNRRRTRLRTQYQNILNKIVVNETFSQDGVPDAAFEFYIAELRLVTGHSRFAMQELITQLWELKKQLTGNSASALINTYYALDLFKVSLKKVKGFGWKWKVAGIQELAAMEYTESVPLILGFLNSRNSILREESFMALVRLQENPLSFLNGYRSHLSRWMELNIFHYLSKLDHRNLPVFSQWFHHENVTVRLFCIRMAQHFRQTSSLPGLAELLYSDNAKIVRHAVVALGELGAYQYRSDVIRLADHVWKFEKLSVAVLRCLGQIGDVHADAGLIARFLSHPLYVVRYEAVAALKKLGAKGDQVLHDFNDHNNNSLQTMLLHFAEPLLQ